MRVAVVGEHAYGVGKGTRTMVGIFVGTGIGGGIIVGGHTHHGGRGVAGEIGHMTLLPHGPRCGCGKRGCVEALASRTAMQRDVFKLIDKGWKSSMPKLMKKHGTETLTSSVIEKALDEGDEVMRKVLRDAQYYLGLLAGNLANVLDPEVIVIGGGITERLGERFVDQIREHAYKHFLVQRDRERVRIVPTELKDLAAPLGAAFSRARARAADALTAHRAHATVRRHGPFRPRSTRQAKRAIAAIIDGLDALYPEAHCELDFASPFQLLIATILSAQMHRRARQHGHAGAVRQIPHAGRSSPAPMRARSSRSSSRPASIATRPRASSARRA